MTLLLKPHIWQWMLSADKQAGKQQGKTFLPELVLLSPNKLPDKDTRLAGASCLGESRQTIRYIGELDVQVLGKIASGKLF